MYSRDLRLQHTASLRTFDIISLCRHYILSHDTNLLAETINRSRKSITKATKAFQLNKHDKCAARIRDRQLLVLTNDTAEQTDFRTSIKAVPISMSIHTAFIRYANHPTREFIRHEVPCVPDSNLSSRTFVQTNNSRHVMPAICTVCSNPCTLY